MFFFRYGTRVPALDFRGHDYRNGRIFESLWVRRMRSATHHSDFFPVILNFLRQVPIVGQLLSLPVIGTVRVYCEETDAGYGSFSRGATLGCLRVLASTQDTALFGQQQGYDKGMSLFPFLECCHVHDCIVACGFQCIVCQAGGGNHVA